MVGHELTRGLAEERQLCPPLLLQRQDRQTSAARPTSSYAGKTPLLDQPYWDMAGR